MDLQPGTWATIKDAGLFVVAIYGAALSTVNFRQTNRKERRILKVTFHSTIPTYGSDLGPTFVQLSAINSGHRAVTVTSLTLQLPDGSQMFSFDTRTALGMLNTQLPARLEEGQQADWFIPYADVADALLRRGVSKEIRLTPIARDSVGGTYRGKRIKVNPKEWRNM